MKWQLSAVREHLFYLFIFLLPWQTRWIVIDPRFQGDIWEYHRVSLYGWDILLVLLVVLYGRELIHAFIRLAARRSPLLLSYLVLVVVAFFAGSWARDSALALYWNWRLVEAGVLALLVFAMQPSLIRVFSSLAAAGTLQSVWALIQFGTQATLANKWLGVAIHAISEGGSSVVLTESGRWLRAYAGQVHPNVLGGLLALTILATVYLYVRQSWGRYSHWFLLPIAFQVMALVVTFSRSAWIALALGMFAWWFVAHEQRRVVTFISLFMCGVAVLTGLLVSDPMLARLTAHGRLEAQSVEERVVSARESGSLLKDVWLNGLGMGNYTLALEAREPGHRSYYYQPVHNLALLAFTELGLVGLAALFVLLVLAARVAYPSGWPWLAALIPAAVFDHYWWTTASMLLLAVLVLSLSAQMGRVEQKV